MTMRGGPRETADHRPPAGTGQGAEPQVDAQGFTVYLAFPPGAALGDYVRVTGASGLSVWMAAADFLALTGADPAFAWMWLIGIDGSGNAIVITDGAGTPIKAYTPVP